MRYAIFPLLLCLALPAFATARPEDAALHGVQFVDKNEGWAVGSMGTILHSIDGGKNWEEQRSGTRACLRAVRFNTPYTGWIVGRSELPNLDGAVGVVLKTTDGGLTWNEVARGVLPGLNGVRFFDENNGVVWGDGSDSVPAGVFRTNDGGKSWREAKGSRAASWLAGDFSDTQTGIVGGLWHGLARIKEGNVESLEVPEIRGRAIRGIAFSGDNGLSVGDGGLILRTANHGATWAACTLPISKEAAICCDFRSVAMQGKTAIVAGKPGSVFFRTQDAGATWERIANDWRMPIHAVHLQSETHGWAVGDLGVVLLTTDGGKTWKAAIQGGSRAAVLFVNAQAKQLPTDVVAALGGHDNYYCSALAICSADAKTANPNRAQEEFRFAAAIQAAGGIHADLCWAFPVPDHCEDGNDDAVLADWKAMLPANGIEAKELLLRQMVLNYRMCQPDVIICETLAPGLPSAMQQTLLAAQSAFKLSELESSFTEQIQELNLPAFAPKKLYAIAPESQRENCPVMMDQTVFSKQLLDSPRGYAELAHGQLGSETLAPQRRYFQLVSHRLTGSEKHDSLMQGTILPEGGPGRRKALVLDPTLQFLVKDRETAIQNRKQLETMVDSVSGAAMTTQAIAKTIKELQVMPADVACRAALVLARKLANEGNWIAAREVYLVLVTNYQGTSASLEAMRWLTRYYASGEARRRAEREGLLLLPREAVVNPMDVVRAGYVEPITSKEPQDPVGAHQTWCRSCLDLETKIGTFGPLYARDPGTVLSALAARRQLGLSGDAQKVLDGYFRAVPTAGTLKPGLDLWRDCMAAEAWIANPKNIAEQPKPLALCPSVSKKPMLDGKLDDDCWKAFTPLELKNSTGAVNGHTTKAYLANDDEFIYIGLICTHPEGKQQPKAEKRRRDDDLTGRDRVDILLDLDRDYQTYFRFQVDQRGCVAEDCWGDRTWNPRWFVAVEPTSTGWTAEIAIPRNELSETAPRTGTTWAMNITRVLPGLGAQSWSGPASGTPRPEGMGLLRFVDVVK